jgi:hypothetical protein
MMIFKKLILSFTAATAFTCALASPAEARQRITYLPIKAFDDTGPADRYFTMFGCSDFVQCVSNPNELNDGDIGAGIFSKNQFQYMVYDNFTMAEVSPTNWSSATKVYGVALMFGLQASGNACTQIGAGALNSSFPNGIRTTSAEYCQTASSGAQSVMLPLETPGGVLGWTVPILRQTTFQTYLNRLSSGARQYVAALRIRVIYEAP